MKSVTILDDDNVEVHMTVESSPNQYSIETSATYVPALREQFVDYAFQEYERVFGFRLSSLSKRKDKTISVTICAKSIKDNAIRDVNLLSIENQKHWLLFVQDYLPTGHYELLDD